MAFSTSKAHLLLIHLQILIIISTPFLQKSSCSRTLHHPQTSSNSTTSLHTHHLSTIHSVCKSTPYPNTCINSLKLNINITINPTIINYLLQSLQNAITESIKTSSLFTTPTRGRNPRSIIIEKQKGTIQDCKELHQITLSSLRRTFSWANNLQPPAPQKKKLFNANDARAFLSAALTNRDTCLEGLNTASGPLKSVLVNSIVSSYKHVSNSLSMLMLSKPVRPAPPGGRVRQAGGKHNRRRRLLVDDRYPSWMDRKARRIFGGDDDDDNGSEGDNGDDYGDELGLVVTVAGDGSGNFSRIMDAIEFAPNNSDYRTFIYIREGVYEEYVVIPSNKVNIVLIGDGSDVTFIRGNRSVADGWTTFRSATVAVSGDGFLARDITIENTSGPSKSQAVALRINADFTAIYKSTILGYQDTLYVHSFRQFYRECDICGTVDYIFGNAAVVFQTCNIISRMPLPGQFTVITAQSRISVDQNTGISIQNCTILATEELYYYNTTNSNGNVGKKPVRSYLGRPWRQFARTVYIESYIDDFINKEGWIKWDDNDIGRLDTLYYGEYGNRGPGAGIDGRVSWKGFHVMDFYDASNFTVAEFISSEEWLQFTSFPYDNGI